MKTAALLLLMFSISAHAGDAYTVYGKERGLPIAFVVAGLFALAFLGFSGLSIY